MNDFSASLYDDVNPPQPEIEEGEEEEEEGVVTVEEGVGPSDSVISNVVSITDVNQNQGKLFIGGLRWETQKSDLISHFQQYGTIIDAVVMKDPHTSNSRGFGFVTFQNPSVIDLILKEKHVLHGKQVDVKPAVPREVEKPKEEKIVEDRVEKVFVGGLHQDCDEHDIRDCFAKFGQITEVLIMFDKVTGRNRGFGFVTFESYLSVEKALDAQSVKELSILGKKIEINKAAPKTGSRSGPPSKRDRERDNDNRRQHDAPMRRNERERNDRYDAPQYTPYPQPYQPYPQPYPSYPVIQAPVYRPYNYGYPNMPPHAYPNIPQQILNPQQQQLLQYLQGYQMQMAADAYRPPDAPHSSNKPYGHPENDPRYDPRYGDRQSKY